MENIVCWAIFSNPYGDDDSKTKYLVNPTFSLQFFALSTQKNNEWLTNTVRFSLMSFLCWSIASEWLFSTNYTSIFLEMLVEFLPNDSLWQLSMSKAFTSLLESLPIPLFWLFLPSFDQRLHSKSQIFRHFTSVVLFQFVLLFFKIYYSILKVLIEISDNQQLTV